MSLTTDQLQELQELRTRIGFGLDLQQFINKSPIARYLELRAIQTVEAAQEEFKHVDPFDHKAVLALQLRIKSAENWIGWLEEAISDGEQAEAVLRGEAALPEEDQGGADFD